MLSCNHIPAHVMSSQCQLPVMFFFFPVGGYVRHTWDEVFN